MTLPAGYGKTRPTTNRHPDNEGDGHASRPRAEVVRYPGAVTVQLVPALTVPTEVFN